MFPFLDNYFQRILVSSRHARIKMQKNGIISVIAGAAYGARNALLTRSNWQNLAQARTKFAAKSETKLHCLSM